MIGTESASPGAEVFGWRVPSAYFPWRQSVALSIWPMPSNVSSGPVFTTGRKPWISYLPMLHDHSSGFKHPSHCHLAGTRATRDLGFELWECWKHLVAEYLPTTLNCSRPSVSRATRTLAGPPLLGA